MSKSANRAYLGIVSTPPASWYPDPHQDPHQPARLRYWDGTYWTGYLVNPEHPEKVWHERPPWTPYVPGSTPRGINVPLSIAVTSAF
jgi:hypothetical protein